MMKVQVREANGQLVLLVEGRLAGAFVPELEASWKEVRQSGRRIAVDLKNVTCVDHGGRCLLQSMHACGVVFLRAGLALQDVLEEVMEHGCKD